jgi:hypothetical protein
MKNLDISSAVVTMCTGCFNITNLFLIVIHGLNIFAKKNRVYELKFKIGFIVESCLLRGN